MTRMGGSLTERGWEKEEYAPHKTKARIEMGSPMIVVVENENKLPGVDNNTTTPKNARKLPPMKIREGRDLKTHTLNAKTQKVCVLLMTDWLIAVVKLSPQYWTKYAPL